jgi:hypothetical protein
MEEFAPLRNGACNATPTESLTMPQQMSPAEVVRQVRMWRYAPSRPCSLTAIANAAGISDRSLYNIAELGVVSDKIAAKLAPVLDRLNSNPGQLAPSQRRQPMVQVRGAGRRPGLGS